MLESSKVTKFAVGRDLVVISDGYDTAAEAKQQLAHLSEKMVDLGLAPDLELVTVDVRTTVSKAKAYHDDEPIEEAPDEVADDDDDKDAAAAGV